VVCLPDQENLQLKGVISFKIETYSVICGVSTGDATEGQLKSGRQFKPVPEEIQISPFLFRPEPELFGA